MELNDKRLNDAILKAQTAALLKREIIALFMSDTKEYFMDKSKNPDDKEAVFMGWVDIFGGWNPNKKKSYPVAFTKADLFACFSGYESFPEGSQRYYAQFAVDTHGIALRDNTIEELISIGKKLVREPDEAG